MIMRDKYGWPVEVFIRRPFTNLIRYILHTNIRQTLRLRQCRSAAPQAPATAKGEK